MDPENDAFQVRMFFFGSWKADFQISRKTLQGSMDLCYFCLPNIHLILGRPTKLRVGNIHV